MKKLLLGIIVVLASGCSSIDCPIQTKVTVQYGIYTLDGTEEMAATLTDTLSVWTQRSDGTDTLLLNRGVGLASFSLPVSYQHPEDVLVMRRASAGGVVTLDTVWLKKEDIPHFESVDCAAHFFHELTAVRSTHRGIDTITISNKSVNYDSSVTHLHIRFTNSD